MLTKKTIGFLGAGNLAEALIKGLISSRSVAPGHIVAADRMSERLIHMAEVHEVKVFSRNFEAVRSSDIIFLTVKPQDALGVLAEIAPEAVQGQLLISVAAGITTASIMEALKDAGLKHFMPIVRAMPNTPATVREAATAICAGPGAGTGHLELAAALFSTVGAVTVIEDESLMDAVTGLSGSGPAYVFLFMEALIEAGVKLGLASDTAKALAMQTVLGAAKYAIDSRKDLGELRRMVTSPGGTTMAGLKKLDEGGFCEIIEKAVEAATKRAKELSAGK
ncbi:MAG: pyrroline-5-carboxylate reductase [Deltaproteobacteria bacterium]|nr:pyrroline-5-carboxylate reductase [Deltaproteobacteria bacterium]